MFEDLHCPAVYLSEQAIMALYSYHMTTGIVGKLCYQYMLQFLVFRIIIVAWLAKICLFSSFLSLNNIILGIN